MSTRTRSRRSRAESTSYDGPAVEPKNVAVIGALFLALAVGVALVVHGLM